MKKTWIVTLALALVMAASSAFARTPLRPELRQQIRTIAEASVASAYYIPVNGGINPRVTAWEVYADLLVDECFFEEAVKSLKTEKRAEYNYQVFEMPSSRVCSLEARLPVLRTVWVDRVYADSAPVRVTVNGVEAHRL